MRPVLSIVAAVVTVQFAVPLAEQLGYSVPAGWGWQMFSGDRLVETLVAYDEEGHEADTAGWAVSLRPPVPWTEVAERALCPRADVARVHVIWSDGTEDHIECGQP